MCLAPLAHVRRLFYNILMNVKCLFPCVCLAVCLAGCFSVETAIVKPSNAEHVVMNNYGWKFFDWIPLACGDASEGASGCTFFRDDVTCEKIQARFMSYANGREIDCPMYDVNDSMFIYIFGVPIPYLITYKEITLSGTMK